MHNKFRLYQDRLESQQTFIDTAKGKAAAYFVIATVVITVFAGAGSYFAALYANS